MTQRTVYLTENGCWLRFLRGSLCGESCPGGRPQSSSCSSYTGTHTWAWASSCAFSSLSLPDEEHLSSSDDQSSDPGKKQPERLHELSHLRYLPVPSMRLGAVPRWATILQAASPPICTIRSGTWSGAITALRGPAHWVLSRGGPFQPTRVRQETRQTGTVLLATLSSPRCSSSAQ